MEPFARTSHPADYVPRPETDRLLDQLEEWAIHGSSTAIWLVGSPGMGRTLLLRVLRERIAGRRNAIFLPYPILPPDELARWVLDAFDRTSGSDPQARLVKYAKKLSGKGGVLLLLDDAMWLPPETQDAIRAWSAASGGALRAVFATTEIPDSVGNGAPVEAALLTLSAPLDLDESVALLHAAMDRARFEPQQRAHLNHATSLQLHDRSRGVPAQLLDCAASAFSDWDAHIPPTGPTAFTDPGPLPTHRDLARDEYSTNRGDTPPQRHAAPDPATSILAPTLPPARSTAATVGVAAAWVVAAGALVALMTASMTGWLRESTADTAAVAVPQALPEVAAAPVFERVEARVDEPATIASEPLAAASIPLDPEPKNEPGAGPEPVAIVAVTPEAVIEPEPAITASDEAPTVVTAPVAPVAVVVEEIAAEPERAPIPAVGRGEPSPSEPDPTPDRQVAEEQTEAAPVTIARVEATEPEPSTANPKPDPDVAPMQTTSETDLRVREGVIGKGEWLAASLRKHGIPTSVATRIAHEVGSAFDFRYARAGQHYRITQDGAGELVAFDYEIAPGDDLELRRVDGRYQVTRSGH